MVEVYKHLHVYDKNTLPNAFRKKVRPSRKHDHQLVPNFSRDGVRGVQKNSFHYRTIQLWNDLPREVVDSLSVSEFKRTLDKAWQDAWYSF